MYIRSGTPSPGTAERILSPKHHQHQHQHQQHHKSHSVSFAMPGASNIGSPSITIPTPSNLHSDSVADPGPCPSGKDRPIPWSFHRMMLSRNLRIVGAVVLLLCGAALFFAAMQPPSDITPLDAEPPANRNILPAQMKKGETSEIKYILIIDAGSSGSRVHVHAYENSFPIPVIHASKALKMRPGLSACEDDPERARESITKLMEFAKKQVPKAQWAETPVFLKATAGLRSIAEMSAMVILDVCRDVLDMSPFVFDHKWAEVISGSQEGIFGWMAANYLEGHFGTERVPTVGVIEMGGASMQITFVPANTAQVEPSRMHHVKVGPNTYQIYTHSYLNYGLEAAQHLFEERNRAALEQDGGNPCYLRNSKSVSGSFDGVGSHAKCAAMMDNIMSKSKCPARAFARMSCSIAGTYQPRITTEKFYAIENFFYTSEFFDVRGQDDPFEALMHKGHEFCKMDWNEVPSLYKKERTTELNKYCFSSAYLPKVLAAGFGIDSLRDSLRIVHEIDGVAIDWALGAALFEVLTQRDLEAEGGNCANIATSSSRMSFMSSPANASFAKKMFLGVMIIALFFAAIVTKYLARAKATRSSGWQTA
jgi:apyrase